jgi:ubiquitin C-terminal hydrolase
MPVNQVLSNCPEIIALGIAWSTGTPTREIVEETLRAIDTSFNTREMFDSVDKPKVYSLQGCICYYGLHYVAFFKVNKKWYQYDDVVIREVCKWFQRPVDVS